MIKRGFLFLIFLFFYMYSYSQERYRITRIKKNNNYYIIYSQNSIGKYKIISKKEDFMSEKKIKSLRRYVFELVPFRDVALIINGVDYYSDNVECYSFGNNTVICREPKKKYFDLYYAKNLKGLYLVE